MRARDAGAMTAFQSAITFERRAPGWLRRTWEIGLPNQQWPDRTDCSERRGHLLSGTLPETLEPFISPAPPPGVDYDDTRILDFEGLDSACAATLLAALPTGALGHDFAMYAPSSRTMLRVVAEHPGRVTADGTVYSPQLPAESIRPRRLTILDPTLTDVAPDVVPGELPDWTEDLTNDEYVEFLRARQHCIDHGTTRPAWLAAITRYGIDDARRFPYARILTDRGGTVRGVQFSW